VRLCPFRNSFPGLGVKFMLYLGRGVRLNRGLIVINKILVVVIIGLTDSDYVPKPRWEKVNEKLRTSLLYEYPEDAILLLFKV
jgi:hypothetical protein